MVDVVRRVRGGRAIVREARADEWTDEQRAAFFDHLTATANVTRSCAAAGIDRVHAYSVRRRDPVFAEQWHAALMAGYDRLEAALLEHAMRILPHSEREDADDPVDVRTAMDILKMHHARQVRGEGKPRGPKVRRATPEETDAAILKQLAALARRKVEAS